MSRSDGDALTVVLNVADTECTLPTPGAASVLDGGASLTGTGDGASATIPPHGWAVLGH